MRESSYDAGIDTPEDQVLNCYAIAIKKQLSMFHNVFLSFSKEGSITVKLQPWQYSTGLPQYIGIMVVHIKHEINNY